MVDETIVADEQKKTVDEQTTGADGGVATNPDEEVVSKAELDKALAEAQKREGRYKSSMKKNAVDTTSVVENGAVDVEKIVEQKLASIKEEEAFIRKHWEDSINDSLKSMMEAHPSLSMEEALKLTPAWQDPAATADTSTMTMVWVAWDVGNSKTSITEEKLYSLSDAEYARTMEKIESWALTLV